MADRRKNDSFPVNRRQRERRINTRLRDNLEKAWIATVSARHLSLTVPPLMFREAYIQGWQGGKWEGRYDR